MGIEKDIERLFASVLEKYRGNKAAAPRSGGFLFARVLRFPYLSLKIFN